ncbi:dihydropteroate synthase [Henriciella litoralis]|uniref:dihydropteroate synthase n=1 Tax=Henriciella litoralis TaxID=568102 RepID=UPI001F47848C|nr:dihydropteroate synthase [Henriciella litoralis]
MSLPGSERNLQRARVLDGARKQTLIMGILNVTPDSFSDGGAHVRRSDAVARARVMEDEGADIIDVGGESTRPGAVPVSEADELARVIPVIEAIVSPGGVPVSIDTYKASVARAAAERGAVIINDVSGLSDPDMIAAAVETGSALVITYNRGEADEACDVARDMPAFFEAALKACDSEGLNRAHVILDPGVGFSKTYRQNYLVMAHLGALKAFGLPVLVGVSRKSMIGKRTGASKSKRLPGTIAAGLHGVMNGARILRVHDVSEHRQALAVWEGLEDAAD